MTGTSYRHTDSFADNSLKNLPLFAVPASLTFGYALTTNKQCAQEADIKLASALYT
jgi:hypothetical protein